MALKPITVSQLNRYIGKILSTDPILGNVSVRGEISNLKYHGSGHVYFSLKDAGSKINCFLPASSAGNLRYQLTDGIEAVVSGYLSVYEAGGYYSLNVRDVEISGAGSLAAAFRALFEKLEKEGLFDPEYKKPIPEFPQKICVITSETGAAVRDILKIIRSRNRLVSVLVYPCLVQGKSAAADIADAIVKVNEKFPDTDVIITGRGGGSAEELWAFNEEIVARSIFASRIPVISAVGHETDFSISDYAADCRAETPTAAAVLAVPDTSEMIGRAEEWKLQMNARMHRILELGEIRLQACHPEVFLRTLKEQVVIRENDAAWLDREISEGIRDFLITYEHEAEKENLRLEAGSPQRIISRGYAAVRDSETGEMISAVRGVLPGDELGIVLKDGELICRVQEKRENT